MTYGCCDYIILPTSHVLSSNNPAGGNFLNGQNNKISYLNLILLCACVFPLHESAFSWKCRTNCIVVLSRKNPAVTKRSTITWYDSLGSDPNFVLQWPFPADYCAKCRWHTAILISHQSSEVTLSSCYRGGSWFKTKIIRHLQKHSGVHMSTCGAHIDTGCFCLASVQT